MLCQPGYTHKSQLTIASCKRCLFNQIEVKLFKIYLAFPKFKFNKSELFTNRHLFQTYWVSSHKNRERMSSFELSQFQKFVNKNFKSTLNIEIQHVSHSNYHLFFEVKLFSLIRNVNEMTGKITQTFLKVPVCCHDEVMRLPILKAIITILALQYLKWISENLMRQIFRIQSLMGFQTIPKGNVSWEKMLCNPPRFPAGKLLNFLAFIKKNHACRHVASKRFQEPGILLVQCDTFGHFHACNSSKTFMF